MQLSVSKCWHSRYSNAWWSGSGGECLSSSRVGAHGQHHHLLHLLSLLSSNWSSTIPNPILR